MSEIWVIGEEGMTIGRHSLQLVSKASDLAAPKKMLVSVVLSGKIEQSVLKQLHQYGAEKAIVCECNIRDIKRYTEILIEMIHKNSPELIMFCSNEMGKYMAAMVSIEFNSGLTADCIDIELDGQEEYVFTRAAMNDSVIARIQCIHSKLNLCTVKENVFHATMRYMAKDIIICTHNYSGEMAKEQKESMDISLISSEKMEKTDNKEWQNAKILFVVGRGACKKECMEKIRQLAKVYGAEIAGTKAAVDEGYIEKHRQVGQSGVNISTNIYVGFGVSGASQHIVGIKNEKLVIAVNNDENASIFDYADYSIVDSVENIVESMLKITDSDFASILIGSYNECT